MNDQHSYLPAIAAVLAAILLPLVWVFELSLAARLNMDEYLEGGLRFGDLLFLLTGALIAFVYFSLRRQLRERFNYRSLDLPLALLVGLQLLFHGTLFVLALTSPLLGAELVGSIGLVFSVMALLAFGALDLVVAILVLRDRQELPELLTVFGIFSALLGVCEITVLLAPGVLVFLPLCLLVLAVQFLRKAEYTAFV